MATITRCASVAAAQQYAAERSATRIAEAIAARGRCTIVLAGGNTPAGMYRRLAAEPLRSTIDWSRVIVLWGDERYVPLDHADSNYRVAHETLLTAVPLLPAQLFPMPVWRENPHEAAQSYAHDVTAQLAAGGGQLDLVLLGMGPDGHTASLFPLHPALTTTDLVTVVRDAPKPPPLRLTLALPALNTARHVLFLVTGSDKAATLRAVLDGAPGYPAGRVQPRQGDVEWVVG